MSPDLARAEWRKSTRSGQQGACVEVAITPAAIGIRDSKNREAGHLIVTPEEWAGFTTGVKAGAFDH